MNKNEIIQNQIALYKADMLSLVKKEIWEDKQEIMLRKLGIALGFTPSNVNHIIAKALSLVDKKVDGDTFVYEMQHMHK